MAVATKKLQLNTKGNDDMLDITGEVAQMVKDSGIKEGTVTVFVTGSTAGVTTIEYESGLKQDMKTILNDLIPSQTDWRHNATWGEGNGHSHLRASIIGSSLTVPVVDGSMTLGTWQQIVLIDFDIKARLRNLVLQAVGE